MMWRFRFALLGLTFFFLLIIARLFYWQVVKAEELSALGQSQYGRSVRLTPTRGEIKTSDNFPIATNKLSYLAFANPKEISELEKTTTLLAPVLNLEQASISALLSQNLFWVPLKRNIESETKEKIEKLKIHGVGFEQSSLRYYPEASMAATLIGFVGKNENGEDKGYFGLEGYYDRQLRGKAGTAIQIYDASGYPILAKLNKNSGKIDGRSLVLNIDRAIQFLVEKKLKKGVDKYQAVNGMAAIIEPSTGKIIALANYPSFNPQNYQDFDDNTYKNPLISNVYEPGSTFKSLVMAAAIDAKVVKPETQCPICSGPVEIGGYKINTWNNEYFKNINMIETIQHSDNTGMVYVSQRMGLDRMLSYFEKFGIGGLTGIDLQGEVEPGLKPKDQWYPIDVATASFGQGISVTPIELLTAFASIANDGKRMEPHMVSKIETPDGQTITIQPKVVSQTISSQTAKVMTEILVNAVDKGEAKFAKTPGYRIAGKTGTAQIPIAGHYDANKTIASFIGFAPADNPKFAMLVIVDRPTTSIYGAETAAPIFFDIAKDLFTYYRILPTENN